MNTVHIGNKKIGLGEPCFVIAEIGMNHDGSMGQAQAFIREAANAGADAVKFQTHLAEHETLPNAPAPHYFTDESRFDYFTRTAFNQAQLNKLKLYAESLGVLFLSSPFSIEAVDLLESIDISAYKIPSGEVTNIPFLQHIARTQKPILISSGMSSLEELDEALAAILPINRNVVVLQCTSSYPCGYDEVGLNMIQTFAERYTCPVGLSDHTLTTAASIAAVVLGAQVIERHFTISRQLYGPDARFSLEPQMFQKLVDEIRAVETMLAHPVDKNDIEKFKQMKSVFEKSIVSLQQIPAGSVISESMITTKKPGTGMHPRYYEQLLGKKTKVSIPKDTIIKKEDIEW